MNKIISVHYLGLRQKGFCGVPGLFYRNMNPSKTSKKILKLDFTPRQQMPLTPVPLDLEEEELSFSPMWFSYQANSWEIQIRLNAVEHSRALSCFHVSSLMCSATMPIHASLCWSECSPPHKRSDCSPFAEQQLVAANKWPHELHEVFM